MTTAEVVPEPAPAPETPATTAPDLICTFCLCPLEPPDGLVGYDYQCGQHECPSGGCVPR